jgi:hypothetical protein
MNDVVLQVCFQSLQQFHSDKNQQEVSKNFEQALNANEKPWRRQDFLSDQNAQMERGKQHHDGEHSSKHKDGELLNFCKQRFQSDLRCRCGAAWRLEGPTTSLWGANTLKVSMDLAQRSPVKINGDGIVSPGASPPTRLRVRQPAPLHKTRLARTMARQMHFAPTSRLVAYRFLRWVFSRSTLLSMLLLALTAANGKSIKMVTSWFNPKYKDQIFHKILVIGVAQNLKVRADFEDEMATQLRVRASRQFPATRSCCVQTPRRNLISTTSAPRSGTMGSTPWSSRVC